MRLRPGRRWPEREGGPRLRRLQVGRRVGGAPTRAGLGRELRPPLGAGFCRVAISLGSPAPRPALGALLSPVTLFALLSGRIQRRRDVELARETACYGTLVEEELGSRETLSFCFPGASFPMVALRGSPARFCLPDSRSSRAGA